ncbi:MAG: acetyl-CoA carboxylase, carboxyltransferase subunit beta [Pseudobutyrivibrio sp.]|nr:acetyl-CoA carboxylase, carboxyltransferase subunit beta [Pseudobutyrivibrio sp.]
MDILDILDSKKNSLNQLQSERRKTVKSGLISCPECGSEFENSFLKIRNRICDNCGHYFSMTPKERIRLVADAGSFVPMFDRMETKDPLEFPGYRDKLDSLKEKTKLKDAVTCGTIKIGGIKTCVGVLDYRFFLGSMGTVVGEQIAGLAEFALDNRLPLIIFCLSGGARMQEGIFSLMQMAKTAAAVEKFKNNGGLYISVLCHPTTGGVSASFAFLGDIILAEPGALIGFAGPRVIESTIGQELPEGFQQAESQEKNGMIDRIVARQELKDVLFRLLKMHMNPLSQG